MAEFATDRLLVTARLMDLVDKLKRMGGCKYLIKKEYPDGNGGVVFEISHPISLWSWGEKIRIKNSICQIKFRRIWLIVVDCISSCKHSINLTRNVPLVFN